MSLVGNLEELGIGEILQIVSLSRKTGVLTMQSRGREGSIFFRHGQVVKALSSIFQQSLGEVLIQKGVIDLTILRKALAFQQEENFQEHLGSVLIKNFGISYETVENIVRDQIENVVFSMFSWLEGTFEFVASEQLESVESNRLDPLQFILNQGLNPQFLAMEGTRLLDDNFNAVEKGLSSSNSAAHVETDFDFKLSGEPSQGFPTPKKKLKPKMPLVIVDDDGPTLKTISDGMRQQGYDVYAMNRSEDTLIKVDALYRGGAHPTILIDLIMPKMDGSGVLGGIELLELLHNNFNEIQIIMMSDYNHADAESKVHDMGYSYLLKPRRTDLNDYIRIQNFLAVLCNEVRKVESGGLITDQHACFNLGDEMRFELGDVDDGLSLSDRVNSSSLSLLRGMLDELNNPDLQGGVLLLVLRFASVFLNRAIVFLVHDKIISGVGQFGVSSGDSSGDEKVRSIHFPLEADSMFYDSFHSLQSCTFSPQPTALDSHIFKQIGGGVPDEAFIGPLICQSRVVGFLYGDNLPEKRLIGDIESLSIFLSQAGIVMEKNNLERQLYESIKK